LENNACLNPHFLFAFTVAPNPAIKKPSHNQLGKSALGLVNTAANWFMGGVETV
jgi:hypothetical protein